MAHTSLAFYRKSQTIDQLQTERPKSLSALHSVFRTAVADVFARSAMNNGSRFPGDAPSAALKEALLLVSQLQRSLSRLSSTHLPPLSHGSFPVVLWGPTLQHSSMVSSS